MEEIKETILESALTHVGYKKGREPKKPWITSDMMSKMGERKKWKIRTQNRVRKSTGS
jgi:hypothetical protein